MNLRSSFEAKILAAFAAAMLVVSVLSITTWKVANDASEAALGVAHTHEVLNSLAHARADTLQIELATQNFRLTGDTAYLAERDAVIAARETVLRRIQLLTARHAGQQERWVRLREVIDARLAISRQIESLRKTQGVQAANAFVATAPLKEARERTYQLLFTDPNCAP